MKIQFYCSLVSDICLNIRFKVIFLVDYFTSVINENHSIFNVFFMSLKFLVLHDNYFWISL